MTLQHDSAPERQPGGSRHNAHCPLRWPVVTSCAALLTGAVTLVIIHKAGVTFLVIFVSSTAIMVLLMAESGHGLLTVTVQHGLAKLRVLRSLVSRSDMRRVAAWIRHPRLVVAGLMLNRRHT